MSREVEKDFQKLQLFLADYSLKSLSDNEFFLEQLKCMHRKLFSYLVFVNEIESQSCIHEISLDFFKEVGSDLIQTLFCWINGSYKSAKLQIRSSIENFIKAMVYLQNKNIIILKSVYEVFDLAKEQLCFNNSYSYNHFEIIHNEYVDLCSTVHGAYDKLSKVYGLIQFPEYNVKYAEEVYEHFDKIINSILCMVYYTYYDNVYMMHELNRELFIQGIEKKEKTKIYRMKTS